MNTVLEKGNIIAKIRRGEDLNQIIDYPLSRDYPLGTEICGQDRYAGAECGG